MHEFAAPVLSQPCGSTEGEWLGEGGGRRARGRGKRIEQRASGRCPPGRAPRRLRFSLRTGMCASCRDAATRPNPGNRDPHRDRSVTTAAAGACGPRRREDPGDGGLHDLIRRRPLPGPRPREERSTRIGGALTPWHGKSAPGRPAAALRAACHRLRPIRHFANFGRHPHGAAHPEAVCRRWGAPQGQVRLHGCKQSQATHAKLKVLMCSRALATLRMILTYAHMPECNGLHCEKASTSKPKHIYRRPDHREQCKHYELCSFLTCAPSLLKEPCESPLGRSNLFGLPSRPKASPLLFYPAQGGNCKCAVRMCV